jgi:hypothetical protein
MTLGTEFCQTRPVHVRNQPLRIVVVVGLWAMWVLWTINRFTSTVIAQVPQPPGSCHNQSCQAPMVAVTREFQWTWWHFMFTIIGAALLVAASVIMLRTPRTIDEI